MKRKESVKQTCSQFTLAADYELSRSFDVVKTTLGRLKVAPIRAVNIPRSSCPVFVQMTYGDQLLRTKEAMANEGVGDPGVSEGDTIQWVSPEDGRSYSGKGSMHQYLGDDKGIDDTSKTFHVDTLNIRGSIRVSLVKEHWRRQKEIVFVDIPIFGILDTICVPNTDLMTRWFSLNDRHVNFPPTSETDSIQADCDDADFDPSAARGRPYICLAFRWMPEALKLSDVTTPKFHARIDVPSLSVSIIDSDRVCEIIQLYVSEVNVRYSDSVETTETSVNITWLQIDNQLPDAASSVILSPTAILRPQPVVRMHILRNNNLCHEHLASYDLVILIVQELDLQLEQQTVTALWEITQNYLMERSTKAAENESQPLQVKKDSLIFTKRGTDSAVDMCQTAIDDDKIYCDYFYIAPIMIHVSFITSNSLYKNDGSTGKIGGGKWDTDNMAHGVRNIPLDHSTPVSLFLWQVGAVVLELSSSISDARIELHGMTVSNMFKTMEEVASILQEHYLNSALGQVYRIVGSLDLVSNPVGLLSSLGDGVRDFFFEPAHALISNPTEISKIGGELMKGAFSLARSTADGVLGDMFV